MRRDVRSALATAHSHAFQRGMRGAAQRRGTRIRDDDFWSWRGAMYRARDVARRPSRSSAISRVAFRELRRAGVRTVGEFHYVHHQADGTPYDERTLMSRRRRRAPRSAEGLRIALLRVAYHRAGPGATPRPGSDASATRTSTTCFATSTRCVQNTRMIRTCASGVAPHSVRAVPPAWLAPLAAYARAHALPFHMHVAEQPREVDECVAETGKRPVELLADLGVLSRSLRRRARTHLAAARGALLGDARAFACICATTERDLGDGLPDLGALRAAGARLCTGIDSHVITDPIDDLRALETHERLRTRSRVTFVAAAPERPPSSSGARARSRARSRAASRTPAGRRNRREITRRSRSSTTSSSSTRSSSAGGPCAA